MSNHSAGHDAEKEAAEYLKQQGFRVKELNWKTKYCEIDIVAEKDKAIYFVEVKSRKSTSQGYGYEYITPKKLQQMKFAAELWVSSQKWKGEYQLAVISIDGSAIRLIDNIL